MSDARKGDVVHYVNEPNPGGEFGGLHLAAMILSTQGGSPQVVNLVAFYEGPGQSPADPPHIHLLKINKAHDAENQTPNTWHLRDECNNGE